MLTSRENLSSAAQNKITIYAPIYYVKILLNYGSPEIYAKLFTTLASYKNLTHPLSAPISYHLQRLLTSLNENLTYSSLKDEVFDTAINEVRVFPMSGYNHIDPLLNQQSDYYKAVKAGLKPHLIDAAILQVAVDASAVTFNAKGKITSINSEFKSSDLEGIIFADYQLIRKNDNVRPFRSPANPSTDLIPFLIINNPEITLEQTHSADAATSQSSSSSSTSDNPKAPIDKKEKKKKKSLLGFLKSKKTDSQTSHVPTSQSSSSTSKPPSRRS